MMYGQQDEDRREEKRKSSRQAKQEIITENVLLFSIMTTAFSGPSRLANFRERKVSGLDDPLEGHFKLTLPENEDKPAYEPTVTFNNTRTSMRLFKGKIQRKESTDVKGLQEMKSTDINNRLSINQPQEDLKLVLHDSPQVVEKKPVEEVPQKSTNKRILISRASNEPRKQTVQNQPPVQNQTAPQVQPQPQTQEQKPKKTESPKQIKQEKVEHVNPHDEKPIIREEEVEESKGIPENQNDLIQCPEGCGRKFNRKALEKHAKACKLVFMSKRKEFNSEAKRITSKQQAVLVKETKKKEKQQLKSTKGFEKTGDNWRATSENFRAAIKGIKKEDDGKEEEAVDIQKEEALNAVACEHCEKLFAPLLLQKHIQTCAKKKEKEREKDKKKGAAIKKK